jgi:transposase
MSHITGTDRSQLNLFPLSIDEMVGQENPVRVIDLFVNQFDFKKLEFKNAVAPEEGQPPYAPSDLMKLYMYGYLNRIRSSRKLEKECERNLELIWLMKGLRPRYHTIADFRSNHPKELKNFFRQFVCLMQGWDLIEGKLISIDGSKFRAVNARKNNFNEKKIERQLDYIDEKINNYLTELDAQDKAEHGDRKIDVEKIKKQIVTQQQRKNKYESLREELKQSGEEQVSTTDKDARSMPVNHNRMDVSYNVQTANDAKHSLIVHYENTNVNDKKALVSVATATKAVLQKETIEVLADKGYHNGEQIDTCTKNDIVTYVAAPDIPRTNDIPTPDYHGDKFIYNAEKDIYTCPAGGTLTTNGRWYPKKNGSKYENKVKHYKTRACKTCPVKAFCTRNRNGRLIERSQYAEAVEANAKRIKAEKEKYALRQQISEHPFGIIKRQWGYDHVLLKGKQKVEAELGLIFSAYNLRRVLTILGFSELKKRLERAFLHFLTLWRFLTHIITKKLAHSYTTLLPVMIVNLYANF